MSALDDTEFLMSEEDIEKTKCVFVLKVRGLTASRATDPLDQRFGCIVFQKSSKGKNIQLMKLDFYGVNKKMTLYDKCC